jgi:hypothetical protein
MAAVQITSGDSRLYYQKADGSIWQYAVNGPFDTGAGFADDQITPADEVLKGTPIVAVQREGSAFQEVNKTNLELSTCFGTYLMFS